MLIAWIGTTKHIIIIPILENFVSVQKRINVVHNVMKMKYNMRMSFPEKRRYLHLRDFKIPIGVNDRNMYTNDRVKRAETIKNEKITLLPIMYS